jgi:hypothetical protein
MAQTAFTHDSRPSMDASLEEASISAATLEKPIRVRLQPALYSYDKRDYQAWAGLTWLVDVADVEEGRRLRQGLADFVCAFGGNERQQQGLLAELEKRAEAVRR